MIPTCPQKLYKYQPYQTWSLDNLKNRILWFSKPSKFNDPFDCMADFEITNISNDDWRKLLIAYKTSEYYDESKNSNYEEDGIPSEEIKRKSLDTIKETLIEYREKVVNKNGVACFAESVDDILMWSHYADGHHGFCLEYDTNFHPFDIKEKVFPVNYSENIPIINPINIIINPGEMVLMELLKTKSSHWSYEKEWRLFHAEGDHEYGVEPSALTGIYFGYSMPFVHKEIISLILRDSPTKFYEMKKEKGKFSVVPVNIEYTPFKYRKSSA